MSMPFYVAPEQVMKDRADYARKGIARGRALVALSYADAVGDPQRDNRLAQAVLHRLAAAKVSGQGQRRHELCELYAPPIRDCRHRPSLDLPTSMRLCAEMGSSQLRV